MRIPHYIVLIKAILLYSLFPLLTFAQLNVDTSHSVNHMVEKVLLGGNVKVSNIKYSGAKHAIAYFINDSSNFQLKKGVFLTTGNVFSAIGLNKSHKTGTENNTRGDYSLFKILPYDNFDAAILEFDFLPTFDSISFNYIFASEEYQEFVGSRFNDIFAFFITGPGIKSEKNIAKLPFSDISVSINNVNHKKNSKYYINNEIDLHKRERTPYAIEFDGLTIVLAVKTEVTPNRWHHIKIVIADVRDLDLDSGVFLEAGSFKSYKNENKNMSSKIKFDKKFFYNIEFESDSFSIKESSLPLLNDLLNYLTQNEELRIIINGHTDSTGAYEYNMELSKLRSKSVAEYLISSGIKAGRVSYNGFGSTDNIAINSTIEGRAKNRRIEFIIVGVED